MADKLNYTQIFENTNYQEIPDMTPIEYAGERERERERERRTSCLVVENNNINLF